MKTITVNNFSGGIAEDLREQKTNTFSYASGFDTFSNSHKITPYRTMETESIDTGTLSHYKMTDVVIMKDSVNTNIYALGQAGNGDTNPRFFQKSTVLDISSTFQSATGGEDTQYIVIPGTLVEYKNRLFCMSQDGTATYVRAYNHVAGSIAAIGTISAYPQVSSNVIFPKPFRHPQDDILYFGAGNIVAKYDNSTFTAAALTLPTELYITSITEYGAYLAIATAPTIGGGQSRVYLWDRNSSLTTVSEVINFGEGTLAVLENINNVLVGVMSNRTPTTNSVFELKNKIFVKIYSGGNPVVVKEITTTSSTFTLHGFKSKVANRLYFACKASINGTALNQIFVVGKNTSGQWFVASDKLVNNNTALTGGINGFSVIGDYLWVGFNDDGTFYRTRFASDTYPTCTYESLINPNMEIGDRSKRKKLVSVSVAKATTTGALTVYYKVDGGSYNTIGTLSDSGSLVLKATNESTGKPMEEGYEYQFKVESTTGAEFTELKYNYEIVNELI